MKHKKITAKEFDKIADEGGDLTPHLDLQSIERPGRGGKRPGAGRPLTGRIGRSIRLTPATWKRIETEASRSRRTVSEVIETAVMTHR